MIDFYRFLIDFSSIFHTFFDALFCYLAGDVRESEKVKIDDRFTFLKIFTMSA